MSTRSNLNPNVLIPLNLEKSKGKNDAKRMVRRDEGKSVVSSYVHCCDSVEDSALEQGNKIFREEEKREAAKKLWNSIATLGVEGNEKDEVYLEAVKQMEARDCEGKWRLMAEQYKGVR